jgi:hypothetical protein
MANEIDDALAAIVAARNEAAKPLVFTDEAGAASDRRSRSQFEASLPLIDGGFETVRVGLLRASILFGEVAKAVAKFHDPNATHITLDQMNSARAFIERECRLRLAEKEGKRAEDVNVLDGLVC